MLYSTSFSCGVCVCLFCVCVPRVCLHMRMLFVCVQRLMCVYVFVGLHVSMCAAFTFIGTESRIKNHTHLFEGFQDEVDHLHVRICCSCVHVCAQTKYKTVFSTEIPSPHSKLSHTMCTQLLRSKQLHFFTASDFILCHPWENGVRCRKRSRLATKWSE